MRHRSFLPALAALAVLSAGGCAAPDESSPSTTNESAAPVSGVQKDDEIAAMLPADIREAGTVRVASGVSFPPMEYYDTDNKTVIGFDADLGKALGEVLGVTFEFENTNFDGIIGGLEANRYDLSLTSMIDKAERQESVDFIDYLNSGVAFLTLKGNPEGITERLDLCGRGVAVEKAATGDIVADEISVECKDAGEDPVDKLPFPDQASAVQALKAGRADAVLALDLTLAHNVLQDPDSFEIPAEPFGLLPVGIPVPKDNTELRDAVQAALLKLQDEGVYDEILAKWNLEDQALEGAPLNTGK